MQKSAAPRAAVFLLSPENRKGGVSTTPPPIRARVKRHFLKIFPDYFLMLMEDAKSMLDKLLKVSRRYLPPFLSFRENLAGGAESPPPAKRGAG